MMNFEDFKAFHLKWETSMNLHDKMLIAEKTDELNYNGCIALENNDVYQALIYFTDALEVMPTNTDALQNLLLCSEELNDRASIQRIKMKLEYLHNFKSRQTSDKVDNLNENELKLNFLFHSSDHLRHQNGVHVSGPHGGAPRVIKVKPNIEGNEGYTVSIYNTDGGGVTLQMAPKQMKLQLIENNRIQLIGYGRDAYGASFSDYGLTIYHSEGVIEKCILHMYDRGVDIEYKK